MIQLKRGATVRINLRATGDEKHAASRSSTFDLMMVIYGLLLCVFFQAEDGIRDVAVTGVQTCALPISLISGLFQGPIIPRKLLYFAATDPLTGTGGAIHLWSGALEPIVQTLFPRRAGDACKIGRASCRERV